LTQPNPVGQDHRLAQPLLTELERSLQDIRESPREDGAIALIVCRPEEDGREVLVQGELSTSSGLIGDNWDTSGGAEPPDVTVQLTLMNSRAAEAVAGARERWPLAGDQLYVDFDLSGTHLPPGTRLKVGNAVIEVTDEPHRGCGKFAARFGVDAMKFVNSPVGRELNLRGINTRVVVGGSVKVGDGITKLV